MKIYTLILLLFTSLTLLAQKENCEHSTTYCKSTNKFDNNYTLSFRICDNHPETKSGSFKISHNLTDRVILEKALEMRELGHFDVEIFNQICQENTHIKIDHSPALELNEVNLSTVNNDFMEFKNHECETHHRFDYKNCPNRTWFDGCNTCATSKNGHSICTKRMCQSYQKPYCI